MKYDYDETGIAFSYFLISILAVILVPSTGYLLSAKKGGSSGPADHNVPWAKTRRVFNATRQKEGSSWKWLLIIAGWSLLAILSYNAYYNKIEEKLWDPYEILDLSQGATPSEIKKQFRKLSLTWHPDKVPEEKKAEAELKFVEISKAHKVLTDDEARQNYEEFGHPDGKQSFSLGIALPAWLVSEGNAALVLLAYGLVFGVGLPILVARWWYSSKDFTKDKILHQTMGHFYREIKEGMTTKSLMELLTTALEFNGKVTLPKNDGGSLAKLTETVRTQLEEVCSERLEKSKKYGQLPWCYKVSVLLHSHLLRIPIDDPVLAQEREFVVEKSVLLVGGMLQIAFSKTNLNLAATVLELGQMIVQAVPYHQTPFAQLPHLSAEVLKHFKTKKRNVATIQELVTMPETERSNLLRTLSSEQMAEVLKVAEYYPRAVVSKSELFVEGEPAIIPSSLITLSLIIKLERPGVHSDVVSDTEVEATREDKWWESKKDVGEPAHAPFFPSLKTPVWWILVGDAKTNKMICGPTKVTGLTSAKKVVIQFPAPPKEGTWELQVLVKSDCYVGCDSVDKLMLHVQPASAAPLDYVEDEISEPDEDTIAGQMNAMRGQGKAPAAGKGSDDSDSDDSDDD